MTEVNIHNDYEKLFEQYRTAPVGIDVNCRMGIIAIDGRITPFLQMDYPAGNIAVGRWLDVVKNNQHFWLSAHNKPEDTEHGELMTDIALFGIRNQFDAVDRSGEQLVTFVGTVSKESVDKFRESCLHVQAATGLCGFLLSIWDGRKGHMLVLRMPRSPDLQNPVFGRYEGDPYISPLDEAMYDVLHADAPDQNPKERTHG